jgi:hypothetical protein
MQACARLCKIMHSAKVSISGPQGIPHDPKSGFLDEYWGCEPKNILFQFSEILKFLRFLGFLTACIFWTREAENFQVPKAELPTGAFGGWFQDARLCKLCNVHILSPCSEPENAHQVRKPPSHPPNKGDTPSPL